MRFASFFRTLQTTAAFLASYTACDAHEHPPGESHGLGEELHGHEDNAPDWWTGEHVSLADTLFPSLHLETALGSASRDQEDLRLGHHDPIRRDGFTWQNLEADLLGRFGEHHEVFIVYAANAGEDDEFDAELEEAFWKLHELPGHFEVRGGLFNNRFGIQNAHHPHEFDWIDQYLMNGRLLGDDSLATIGAEVSWVAPLPWTSQLDFSWGKPPAHDDEDEPFGGQYNPEEAHFGRHFTTANWTNTGHLNDRNQWGGGLSGAWGTNHADYQTCVYGAHFEYQWRQHGEQPGGRYFRLRTEAMFNRFKVDDELGLHPNPVTQQDFGCYLNALYGLPNQLELGARAEFVAGNGETQRDARFRFSPGITWYANQARTLRFRLQYNCDHSNVFGTDHGIWAQISLAWGEADAH